MEQAPHFIQVGDDPAIIGEGTDDLRCQCGQSVLVKGYLPFNLLGIDIRCSRCGAITTTPGLLAETVPPAAVTPIDRRDQPLPRPATVARLTALASHEELARLTRLYAPQTPPSDRCAIDATLLDLVEADYDRLSGGRLDEHLGAVAAAGSGPLAGFRSHPLAWAVRHLRATHGAPGWTWFGTDEGSAATTIVGAFRHFVACWSHHPLFPAMAAAAADRGFSLHATAVFGAAKCLSDSGNRIAFTAPDPADGRVTDFSLAIGPTERWAVRVEVFDAFEWPFGKPWDQGTLRSAVTASVTAAQSRINLRHPGLLVLSAGAARSAFDQPLVEAINDAVQSHGSRNRGLAAVCAIMPKLVETEKPNEARFSFAFYPIANRRFIGEIRS